MKTLITLFVLLSFHLSAQQNVFAISTPLFDNYVDFEVQNSAIYAVTIDVAPIEENMRGPIISMLPIDGSPGTLKKLIVPENFGSGIYSSIRKCPSSNHFVAAFYANENCDAYIVKFDQSLNIIWCKKLSFPTTPNLSSSQMSSNLLTITEQDDIFISLTPSFGSIICKLDSNGALIFSKKIQAQNSTPSMSDGFSFIRTSDGGYLVTLSKNWDPIVLKLNSEFQIEWSKLYDLDTYSSPRASEELSTGNFVVIFGEEGATKIAELSPQGELLSLKQGPVFTFPFTIEASSNGNYQVFDVYGTYFKSNSTDSNNLLLNFDHSMNSLPIFRNGNRYVFNRAVVQSFYFIANDQASSCYDLIVDSITLTNVPYNPNVVVDAALTMEDFGAVSDYNGGWGINHTVSVTETCGDLANKELENGIVSVYPNPSSNEEIINLKLSSTAINNVQIFNSIGQLVTTINCADKEVVQFAIDEPSGVYVIVALDKNAHQLGTQKLVIE